VFIATDIVVLGLRAIGFVATFQAVGALLFLWLFGKELTVVAGAVRALARSSALVGAALVAAYHVLLPARMAGSFAATFDPSLTALLMESDAGAAHLLRLVGLALIAVSFDVSDRFERIAGLAGAVLAILSFAAVGHTAIHELRPLLGVALLVHVTVACGWFGALVPLVLTARRESPACAAAVLAGFSRVATWAVPLILVCGLLIGLVFVRDEDELFTAYGALLIGKTAAFGALLVLAAANKGRYVPRLVAGERAAAAAFERTVRAEWLLMAAVLVGTAVMTALFSPESLTATFDAEHSMP
jgi:putative copper resistance protein D